MVSLGYGDIMTVDKFQEIDILRPAFALSCDLIWYQCQWASPVQVLVFTRGRKSDGAGSVPFELGRISQAVKVTISSSFGNTCRFCPPNPRHIQTYSVESGSLDNHHLKPYFNCGSSVWKYGVTDSFTHALETIRWPFHIPSCKYK